MSDANARYGASTGSLLQVAGDGSLAYLDFASGNQTWTSIDLSTVNQTSTNTSSTATISGTPSATTALAVGPNNAAPSANQTSGASRCHALLATPLALLLPILAVFTIF